MYASSRKFHIRRRYLVLLALLIALGAAFFTVERNVTRVVLTLSQATARNIAIRALNEAAQELLQEGVRYDELMHVTVDETGQVRLIQANTPQMNALASKASLLAQGKMSGLKERTLTVPLGSALGLTLFAGVGPGIQVTILPVGNVQAAFVTDFTTAGINQTRHRVSLTLTATVQIVIPTGAKSVQATTQVAMAESIIVGEVPDSFTDVGDLSLLDLAP